MLFQEFISIQISMFHHIIFGVIQHTLISKVYSICKRISVFSLDGVPSNQLCELQLQNLLELSINANNTSSTSYDVTAKSNPSLNSVSSLRFLVLLICSTMFKDGHDEVLFIGFIFLVYGSSLAMSEKKGQMLQYLRSFGLYVHEVTMIFICRKLHIFIVTTFHSWSCRLLLVWCLRLQDICFISTI